jgi:hypothetical protein
MRQLSGTKGGTGTAMGGHVVWGKGKAGGEGDVFTPYGKIAGEAWGEMLGCTSSFGRICSMGILYIE